MAFGCRPAYNGAEVNVESYARDFLRDRGYQAGVDYDGENCVDMAANVLTNVPKMVKLAELRTVAAMAQFSEREVRSDILRLIETTGDVVGDAMVMVGIDSVQIQTKEQS